jgi:nucleoside-diphosphate-sugar epimerase
LRILLTGATGFIGSHLLRGLVQDAHDVVVLKRGSSNTGRIDDLMGRVEWHDLEQCGPQEWPVLFQGMDAVVHAATDYAREARSSTVVEANVLFPLRLLETLVVAGRGVFVNTDSSFTKNPADYAHLQAYTTSKRQFLDWARLAVAGTAVAFVNMRLEHPYGPGDRDDKFVQRMILDCLAGRPEIDLTAGEQQRDFVYVDDVVTAYRAVLRRGRPEAGEFVCHEVGTGRATTVRRMVETIHHFCGSCSRLNFGALPYRHGEMMHSVADTSSLGRLGYIPAYDLETGLRATIAAARSGHLDSPERSECGR